MEKQAGHIEEIFHFSGKWDMPSHCGLSIRQSGDDIRVILTEMYETNPGSSVTSMIGALALMIVRKYGIDPERAIFIVHNPERSTRYNFFSENFYKALMDWDGEKFNHRGWEKLEG